MKNKYDAEPVFYCTHCLSLNIRELDYLKNKSVCFDCGNGDIKMTSIDEWNRRYVEEYGQLFLAREED